jgi:hypothetical protein
MDDNVVAKTQGTDVPVGDLQKGWDQSEVKGLRVKTEIQAEAIYEEGTNAVKAVLS